LQKFLLGLARYLAFVPAPSDPNVKRPALQLLGKPEDCSGCFLLELGSRSEIE
jgi:hypothetical protein